MNDLLTDGLVYSWTVRGLNEAGYGSWATPFTFTVNDDPMPVTPTLDTPANGSTLTSLEVDFHWNTSLRAETYDIQIASDSGFITILTTATGLTGTHYSYTFTGNSTYYWKVRATNGSGSSAYTSGRSVVVNAVISQTPLQVGLDDIWVRGDDITLSGSNVSSWNDKSGNARHLTNATTGNRPITETLSGKTFVKFEGTSVAVRNLSFNDSTHIFKLTGTQTRTFMFALYTRDNTAR